MTTETEQACLCPDGADCWYVGYPYCRACEEHHRLPECPVDAEGFSLAPCGCRWDEGPLPAEHRPGCYIHDV